MSYAPIQFGGPWPYGAIFTKRCVHMHAYDQGPEHARRLVALLVDGLRYGASSSVNTPS
jgi:hypothetical protein